MASDYSSIKIDNVRRYGTDIGRIGPMLLSNRYDDRTHFIFELLQNAEDALKRREGRGQRAVHFELGKRSLRVSHFGKPFSDSDVRGICGIGESTKPEELTAIGKFGIGFKAVFAFTDVPEIHSGDEHFAVDSFVWPRGVDRVTLRDGETAFLFPFREDDTTAFDDIAAGLKQLGARTLLFLREIEEIGWKTEDGRSGLYLRDKPIPYGVNGRKIVLVGQEKGHDTTEETWLIFSREVRSDEAKSAGYVEIAFAIGRGEEQQSDSIRKVSDSKLVVYFPTIVPTYLGFLVQGPYRTTPSRDNVPRNDKWNRHLVLETADLLVESLRSLKELKLLTVEPLLTLPLDRTKFGEGTMFSPLFDSVKAALEKEPLLPNSRKGHVLSRQAKLSRTKDLRDLFESQQLSVLFESPEGIEWLSGQITSDRTPELRQYLMRELNIAEVIPETILPRLTGSFLEAQSDTWVILLYQFLSAQPVLKSRLNDIPLIRLETGKHVTLLKNGERQAFFPSVLPTGFPTVSRVIHASKAAREFLADLGVTEPDPVDDVIRNVLPKYAAKEIVVKVDDYASDISRMVKAYATDSKTQREKLLSNLRNVCFLKTVNCGDGTVWFTPPRNAYLPSQKLKSLFEGIPDVFMVDESCQCLRGEAVREFLEACGASRYLLPIQTDSRFTWQDLAAMRTAAGASKSTRGDDVEDFTLLGLDSLLKHLDGLPIEVSLKKGGLLWEALCDLEERRGSNVFTGSYNWFYLTPQNCGFDASFVKALNANAWVPDENTVLNIPSLVVFESISPAWKANPFLLSKIRFKPPLIDTLAKEAGFEPGLLDLLKKLGLTSEAQLKERLGIKEEPLGLTPEEALTKLGILPASPPTDDGGPEISSGIGGSGARPGGSGTGSNGNGDGGSGGTSGGSDGHKTGTGTGNDSHTFISYIGSHSEPDEPDPDGLSQQERLALEESAIKLIISSEPELLRTPINNPGFDLVCNDDKGQALRWVEVKAMKGNFKSRAVGLSKKQFETAQLRGLSYWLYVVECAGSELDARIIRIQDPAGKARTFTFDHGWLNVAQIDNPSRANQDKPNKD